jgi:hypothetical protein
MTSILRSYGRLAPRPPRAGDLIVLSATWWPMLRVIVTAQKNVDLCRRVIHHLIDLGLTGPVFSDRASFEELTEKSSRYRFCEV